MGGVIGRCHFHINAVVHWSFLGRSKSALRITVENRLRPVDAISPQSQDAIEYRGEDGYIGGDAIPGPERLSRYCFHPQRAKIPRNFGMTPQRLGIVPIC
jgi:hypothetical protein